MGKASRDKGNRGEREVEGVFRSHRLSLMHLQHTGDRWLPYPLGGSHGFHVESKRCEVFRVPDWLAQAYSDAAEYGVPMHPVVAFRRNVRSAGDPAGRWHAIIPLDVLCELLGGRRSS